MASNAVARETLFALRETIARMEGKPVPALSAAEHDRLGNESAVSGRVPSGGKTLLSSGVADLDAALKSLENVTMPLGIPDAQLEAVLEPFVRLDPARARDTIGLGLGLSIVVRAVADHDGVLTLANRAGGGLRAEIALPIR